MNNYLFLVVLPNIRAFFVITGGLGIIGCLIAFICYLNESIDTYNNEGKEKLKKFRKGIVTTLIVCLCAVFITCFIPQKKDILQFKAISVLQELDGVDKIPQKIIDKLNNILDSCDKDEK